MQWDLGLGLQPKISHWCSEVAGKLQWRAKILTPRSEDCNEYWSHLQNGSLGEGSQNKAQPVTGDHLFIFFTLVRFTQNPKRIDASHNKNEITAQNGFLRTPDAIQAGKDDAYCWISLNCLQLLSFPVYLLERLLPSTFARSDACKCIVIRWHNRQYVQPPGWRPFVHF